MARQGANYPYDEACELLDSGEDSDFTIRCGNRDFPVHRFIIKHKSEYFRVAVGNNFKEGNDGVLDLKETTPAALATAILYCYTNSFPMDCGTKTSFAGLVTPAAIGKKEEVAYVRDLMAVYLLADRLLLENLKKEVCMALLRVLENIRATTSNFKDKLLPIVQYLYNTLSPVDELLRPYIPAWVATNQSWLSGVIGLLALVKKEDSAGYATAMLSVRAAGYGGNVTAAVTQFWASEQA